MPRMYRSMKADGERPLVEQTATGLGVRVPDDVEPDGEGRVAPGRGMSVAPSFADLPRYRVPKRLKHLRDDASGTNASLIWCMGNGTFDVGQVTDRLALLPDPPEDGRIRHGIIEPVQLMDLDLYRAALAETRPLWELAEVEQ